MKIIYYLCLLLTCVSSVAIAYEEQYQDKQQNQDKQIVLLLPVDWTGGKKINCILLIPENFSSVNPLGKKIERMIFLPAGQNRDNFTEVIFVALDIGKRESAIRRLQVELSLLAKLQKNTKIIKKTSSKNKYEESLVIYQGFDEKRGSVEITGIKRLSGPLDCQSIRYSAYVLPDSSPQEVINKIDRFFHENVTVELQ